MKGNKEKKEMLYNKQLYPAFEQMNGTHSLGAKCDGLLWKKKISRFGKPKMI